MKIMLRSPKKLQTVNGLGTSSCRWSQYCTGNAANELSELLYGKDGLGLNIYRYNVGGGFDPDNNRVENMWRRTESLYDFDKTKETGKYNFNSDLTAREFMKLCLEKGSIDTVILFANSPHWSQTSTGQSSGSLLPHTCNLPKMNYKKFVSYILDIAEEFISEGIPVKYISPINEPQWQWGGASVWQEGCHYECEEVLEVFHLFAEEILKRGTPVLLYGPESGEMLGETKRYIEALSGDETIKKVMPVFAYHSYHSDNSPETRLVFKNEIVKAHPEFRFDMSEWCELPNKSPTDCVKAALITARIIGQDFILGGCESWTSWVAVNQFSVKEDGKDYSDGLFSATNYFSEYKKAKRYYALAHYSKFIPVGSVCLDNLTVPENDNGLNAFSFLTPDGKTVTVIVNEKEQTEISFDGDFSKMQIVLTTDEKQFFTAYDGEYKSTLTLPENSLATVIMQ